MKIISWNVNGIRACQKKGFLDWLLKEDADIVGIQEIKAKPEQLPPELKFYPGYHIYFNPAERPGYSGVALYSKTEPISVSYGFGIERFDREGRVIVAEYPEFTFINIYFPNGKQSDERLKYKMDFYQATMDFCKKLRKEGKSLIVSGDYNTAHKEIDLTHPKANEDVSGFLPIERAWLDDWVDAGFIDTFREFHEEPEKYSWWSMRTYARERNVGWRIDYHFASKDLKSKLKDAYIKQDVMGSDHAPIYLEIGN